MKKFTYNGLTFEPYRFLEPDELEENGAKILPWSSNPYNFEYAAFYAAARDADAENDLFDLFKCQGETVIPTGAALCLYREPGEPEHHTIEHTKALPSEASLSLLLAVMDDEGKSGFYPTPVTLAEEMLAAVNWDLVDTILEPSAGKGDLVDAIAKKYEHKFYGNRRPDVDCVEINPDLQLILKGKGYRVVHDDFLSYHTLKRYSLIIMNPPFEYGAEHLMHALDLQKRGGQIVCLLNAETLNNPYTKLRKLLAEQLNRYDARITYYEDSFAEAQRQTGVTVAMVYVNIPAVKDESDIYKRMERAYDIKEETEQEEEHLAPSGTIERMIREYQIETAAGVELIRQYMAFAPYMQDSKDPDKRYASQILELKINGHSHLVKNSRDTLNEYLRLTRYKYWAAVLDNREFVGKLTSDMQKEYHDRLVSLCDYEFSEFNIRQLLADINVNIFRGVEESIEKIFEQLTAQHTWYPECKNNIHYYNGWASNKAHKVNKKVIIPSYGLFSDWKWSTETFRVHEAYNHLADIEKCFNYLDGHTTAEVNLMTALEAANAAGQTKNIHCKFFDVTFYKKGTTHIRFTNERLLEKFNIYCSRHKGWLPPTYGKARYEDMDREAQSVIDEFQGKEAYEAVMREQAYYITSAAQMLALPG